MPKHHPERADRLNNPIAWRRLICVRPTGESFPVTVKIGMPYEQDGRSSRCPVSIDPLHLHLPDIAGSDTLQAVELAMRLVGLLLTDVLEQGSKLYWADAEGRPHGEYNERVQGPTPPAL